MNFYSTDMHVSLNRRTMFLVVEDKLGMKFSDESCLIANCSNVLRSEFLKRTGFV